MSVVSTSAHKPLAGRAITPPPSPFSAYASALLADLGAAGTATQLPSTIDAVAAQQAWANSGAMALTVDQDGAPLPCPAPLAACMSGAWLALRSLLPIVDLDAPALLGERAALFGYGARGAVSPGGSCRLLDTRDSGIALNLARPGDWELLPALFQISRNIAEGDWESVAQQLRMHATGTLCERGRLLGLALAPQPGEPCERNWVEIMACGARAAPVQAPLVIDLSSLWAGPLCTQLLQLAGARVIKVESTHRPDGARSGSTAFFDLLNADKRSVALDLRSAKGIEQLGLLLRHADIVIEASRPRALRQMGIVPEELLCERPGLTWVSITGYGRTKGEAIAFGDDAGVAGGLSALYQHRYKQAVICADAVADPLSGMHAALAAAAGWVGGGGYLLDISLHAVSAHCAAQADVDCGEVRRVERREACGWELRTNSSATPVAAPRARAASAQAPALGADNRAVFAELCPC